MQSVTIGVNQAGQRLDKFLRKYLPQAGTGFLYKMLRKKNITLNGKKAEGSELLAQGDQVCFFFSPETFAKFAGKPAPEGKDSGAAPGSGKNAAGATAVRQNSEQAEYKQAYRCLQGIGVIYEDEHILILDKPAGILTQKAKQDDLSLNEWMIGYLLNRDPGYEKELSGFRPSVCNRLDRNTSGLVLCGKSLPGLQYLSRCIRERSIRKFYRTICVGQLREEARVKGSLVKDQAKNRVHVVTVERDAADGERDTADGAYIETAYRPLRVGEHFTLLEVELITGKPHQIRAHLAGLGHPLIGDFKYGDREVNRRLQEEYGLRHQLLQAFQVVFPEGSSPPGDAVGGRSFTAPCPELFRRLQAELGLS